MADVAPLKKIVSFVTCELTFGRNVCGLMFGINVSNLNLRIKNNPVTQQSKATLWFLDTCLIVGLRPFMNILITASLSSKTYNIALEPECAPFDRTWSMLIRSRLVCVVGIYFCMFGWVFAIGWHLITLIIVRPLCLNVDPFPFKNKNRNGKVLL